MGRMIDDEETLKDNGLIEIDGVNVAECEFFGIWEKQFGRKYGCMIRIKGHKNCEDKHNCYFKQLQRAKAENEKLKAKINDIKQLAQSAPMIDSELSLRILETLSP